MVFLRIIFVDIGTFDGEQTNFWNKLFRFLLFSSPRNPLPLGCPKISFFCRIEPVFLYGMCIGHTRSHAKFQTSGLKDLAWPPLFVNGSWPSRKSYKMTWKLNFWPCNLEGHQKCCPKWYNTWGFRLLEVCQKTGWKLLQWQLFKSGCIWYF